MQQNKSKNNLPVGQENHHLNITTGAPGETGSQAQIVNQTPIKIINIAARIKAITNKTLIMSSD